mgnify:CR=1 FL=1
MKKIRPWSTGVVGMELCSCLPIFLPVIIASSVALGLLESDSVSDMYLSGSMGGMSVQSTQLPNLLMNMGISGNRTDQLFDRLYPDADGHGR